LKLYMFPKKSFRNTTRSAVIFCSPRRARRALTGTSTNQVRPAHFFCAHYFCFHSETSSRLKVRLQGVRRNPSHDSEARFHRTIPSHRCFAALLRCCVAALQRCCFAALLLCCAAALLHCCFAARLRCCAAAFLRCCFAALRPGNCRVQVRNSL
jgi:hypothetical protein